MFVIRDWQGIQYHVAADRLRGVLEWLFEEWERKNRMGKK